jgi:3-oxoacyl-[acyl-carrier protein] reductase
MKKTALITGASRGIGAAAAHALARDGYDIIVNYRVNREEALRVAHDIGGRAVQADVSDVSDVKRMFDGERVDLLVCNAGISVSGLFTDTARDWRRVFETNVGGVINCCDAAIPHMVRQKSGCIITLSSIWGVTGASCEALYSASKSAVIGLTKSLAKELAPSGIRVNCVAPGVIDTDMNNSLTRADIDALRDVTPLGTIGTPNDVAAAIRFLASDGAGFITGQVLSPNGGILC